MQATILIVDDEKNTREGLRMALEDDYDVYTASNADEAYNLIEVESFVSVGKVQPFNVSISSSALLLVDLHAHLSPEPVCGYLGKKL